MTTTAGPGVRAVSLVPSITETLHFWGHDPIACTRFCERDDLPHVGGTKNPDIDAIAALAPDVVLLDVQENRREDADALRAAGLKVVAVDVRSVAGLDAELVALAEAVGAPPPPPIDVAPAPEPTVRAFVPIWRRPWMTIGGDTYGSSVLAAIGVANVFAAAGDDYPVVELDDVRGRRPDVVLAPTEPYDFRPAHHDELQAVAPVVEIDGQDLFWWGARTPSAIARLADAVARWRRSELHDVGGDDPS